MKRNSPGDCSSCTDRWFCKELCDSAKLYSNQDYVYRTEIPTELLPPMQLLHVDCPTRLTPKERKILTLLGSGLSRKEICQAIDIKGNTLRWHIFNIKKKYIKN